MIHHAKQESSGAFCQHPHQLLGRGYFRALVSAPEEQQWNWIKTHSASPSVHFSHRDNPHGRFLEHFWVPRATLGAPRNQSALGSRTAQAHAAGCGGEGLRGGCSLRGNIAAGSMEAGGSSLLGGSYQKPLSLPESPAHVLQPVALRDQAKHWRSTRRH